MGSFEIFTIIIVALAVTTYAAPAPSYGGYGYEPYDDYYEDRDYRFNYIVHDDYTYNHQTRDEHKYGDTVTGQYTVLEPNGKLRVVNYIADDYGFQADVQHRPFSYDSFR